MTTKKIRIAKQILAVFILAIVFIACNNSVKKETSTSSKTENTSKEETNNSPSQKGVVFFV